MSPDPYNRAGLKTWLEGAKHEGIGSAYLHLGIMSPWPTGVVQP